MDILEIMKKNDIKSISTDLITRIAEEECSELIQAISKEARGKANRENTHEEIADVLICISWLIEKLHLDTKEIERWINYKTKRSQNKIDNGTFN